MALWMPSLKTCGGSGIGWASSRATRRAVQAAMAASRMSSTADTGYVFTTPDGQPLHPDYLTRRFRSLVEQSGLPPVRLHDLRHGAASLAHSAGADLKTPCRSSSGTPASC